MSKAILIMDMPGCCAECDLNHECKECMATGTGFFADGFFDQFIHRLSNCPLKPLPEKKNEQRPIIKYNGYGKPISIKHTKDLINIGYNACIDEIGGGTE